MVGPVSDAEKPVKRIIRRDEPVPEEIVQEARELARTRSKKLAWGGPHDIAAEDHSNEAVCSERGVIASIRDAVDRLIELAVKSDTDCRSDGVISTSGPDIAAIIKYIDDYLEQTGQSSLTVQEASVLLAQANLLRESIQRPGRPLRRLLRKRAIPHALQPPGPGGRWHIPHSPMKED